MLKCTPPPDRREGRPALCGGGSIGDVAKVIIRCPECGNEFEVSDPLDPVPLHIYEGIRCPGSGMPGQRVVPRP